MVFEALYHIVPLIFLLVAVLFVGPLFIFTRKLWITRSVGCHQYTVMASHYVDKFDRKWIRGERDLSESQLGTPDLQSLADLTNSVNVIRQMQLIPAGQRLNIELMIAVVVPLLPLLFMKYHLDQLSVGLFKMLTGI